MTLFSHFAHHMSPFLSLKSGEAQTGQASSVRAEPCRSRSAMRLTWSSSDSLRDKLLNPKVNRYEISYNNVTAKFHGGSYG